jgi:MYXO-CTERM domain-containing protein
MEEIPMKRAFAVATVMCLVATVAASANPMRTNVFQSYATADGVVGGRAAPTVPYGTGFETVEGFGVGPVEPQANWTSSLTNHAWSSVSTAHPATGSQHLRTSHPGAGNPTGTYFAKNGDFGDGVVASVARTVSADISISELTAGYTFTAGHLFANGVTGFVGRLYFYPGDWSYDYDYGDIISIEDDNCDGTVAVTEINEIGQYGGDLGTYHNYRMEIDPNAGACGTINYYRDNVLFHTGNMPFLVAGNPANANTIGATRFQGTSNLTGVGDFDNVSITPEPGSLALLGLGALALLRRRK